MLAESCLTSPGELQGETLALGPPGPLVPRAPGTRYNPQRRNTHHKLSPAYRTKEARWLI